MRAGRDPTRRNRKIGRPGHGVRERPAFWVPWPRTESRPPEERFRPREVVEAALHGRELTVLIEPLRAGAVHPCSAADVISVLQQLPAPDTEGIGLVVLRQPTRKEDVFIGAWGRLRFDVRWHSYRGPAVLLEAIDLSKPWLRWTRKLWPASTDELQRLRDDGFQIVEARREYKIRLDAQSARRCQLYRTIPHEVGHWVDWNNRVLGPAAAAPDPDAAYAALCERWDSRPHSERESFAHRYAERVRRELLT